MRDTEIRLEVLKGLGALEGVFTEECVLPGATGRVPGERHCRDSRNTEQDALPSLCSSDLPALGKQNDLCMWVGPSSRSHEDGCLAQRKKEHIMMEFRHLCCISPLTLRREGGRRMYQPDWDIFESEREH